MTELKEYSTIRIVKLSRPVNEYNGWGLNQRNPKIGDIGMLIDTLHAPNFPNKYVVENVGNDGQTIWLSDFFADEIEPIETQNDGLG